MAHRAKPCVPVTFRPQIYDQTRVFIQTGELQRVLMRTRFDRERLCYILTVPMHSDAIDLSHATHVLRFHFVLLFVVAVPHLPREVGDSGGIDGDLAAAVEELQDGRRHPLLGHSHTSSSKKSGPVYKILPSMLCVSLVPGWKIDSRQAARLCRADHFASSISTMVFERHRFRISNLKFRLSSLR